MEGRLRGLSTSLQLTRCAESSRVQLDLVRRAFELLAPNIRSAFSPQQKVPDKLPSAAAACAIKEREV